MMNQSVFTTNYNLPTTPVTVKVNGGETIMSTTDRPVRVRFAPSPTGDLHVGGVRTALFTYLFARQHDGVFILRIEDTDQKRYDESSITSITEALRWVGLHWDEGPDVGGPHGPYIQSQRLDLYRRGADTLLASGHAYECFCSPERLAALREEQRKAGRPPGYDRHCRNLTDEERRACRDQGIEPVVRLKVPLEGTTSGYDLLRGPITFENSKIEDAVLLKSDGYPTYHLAVVLDDHDMGITHVTRGEEWIPSMPLHLIIWDAFGWERPVFAHMPTILKPDGKGKLSKREGAASALAFRDKGYLPEAMVNYLALVGWAYDDRQEIFSMDELIEKFDIERVSPSPARFNYEKLDWMNQHYINHILDVDDLTARVIPWLVQPGLIDGAPEGSQTYGLVRDAVVLVKDKMKLLAEAPDLIGYFLVEPPDYDAGLLVPRKTEPADALRALEAAREAIADLGVEDEERLEERLRAVADDLGLKAGQMFMPIRVAVTGRTASPGLFETLRVVNAERSLARLDRAIEKLRQLDALAAD
jgi:glutamyl-tRNA synthetase